VRVERRRTKKLIVAFHFQFANQAAWRCDVCRRGGLESARRCGFARFGGAEEPHEPKLTLKPKPQHRRIVWARGHAAATECPKSYISAESIRWIEEFSVWKAGGITDLKKLPARTAEAFFVLEQEWGAEIRNGREQHNQD
jgi:hypothetical protein